MDRKLFFCIALLLLAAPSYAQQKLGKPTDSELKMTEFPADTAAAAVILSQKTWIYYEMSSSREGGLFNLVHDYEVRIKVLKPEGVEIADIEIPYYENGNVKERIRVVSATAYNLEGGKTVKTTLSRKDIFDEMVSQNYRMMKFSIPDVREGTVIEYRYTINSNLLHNIHDVEIQGDYPVLLSTGEIIIPKVFQYNLNTTGYHRLNVERQPSTIIVPEMYRSVIENTAETIKFSAKDIPALKNEPFVWYPDDFRSKLTVELSGYFIPGYVNERFSTSWSAIDDQLDKGDFGRSLKMSCPLSDEVKQLAAETSDRTELARRILKLVTSKIKWDKTYRLYADNVRRDLKEGSGSSASVNFMLNSALRQAGFTTTPVLLRPRSRGRIPLTHPSLANISTFLIAVHTDDGNVFVIDATDPDNDVNVIQPALMVDRAKLYGSGDRGGWVDLSNPCHNFAITDIECEFDADMKLVGTVRTTKDNLQAMLAKKQYRSAASEEEYIEKIETSNNIEVEDYEISDLSQRNIVESYGFRKTPSQAGNFIYVNATVVPFMSESIFKQQERRLPVELPYTEAYEINCRIKIPEGYAVEELPKSEETSLTDSGITFAYAAREQDGEIVCTMQYIVNRIIYPVNEYPVIFDLYGQIASASRANIVLKKL